MERAIVKLMADYMRSQNPRMLKFSPMIEREIDNEEADRQKMRNGGAASQDMGMKGGRGYSYGRTGIRG